MDILRRGGACAEGCRFHQILALCHIIIVRYVSLSALFLTLTSLNQEQAACRCCLVPMRTRAWRSCQAHVFHRFVTRRSTSLHTFSPHSEPPLYQLLPHTYFQDYLSMSMGENKYENWVRVKEVGASSVGLSHGMTRVKTQQILIFLYLASLHKWNVTVPFVEWMGGCLGACANIALL